MNDKMTPDKERENCPCRKAIINPFDAMMMVVVRRLDKAYLELKRSKPPARSSFSYKAMISSGENTVSMLCRTNSP